MQLTTFIPLAALLSLQISSVLAAPVEVEPIEASSDLEKRATGTQNDPFILDIPCGDFVEVCEAQCIAILCFGAPQILQYGGPGSSTAQRSAAGASSSPFSGTLASIGNGKTVSIPDPAWTSPEDTTNACSTQGGIGTLIAPVLAKHNSSTYPFLLLLLPQTQNLTQPTEEGSKVSGQLSTNKVAKDQYFKKNYSNAGKYCTALMGKQPASSVCSATAPASDQINYMYRRTSKKEGNSFIWQHVKYPTDKWAKNFPGY
ncbi:hypothetical protein CJF31_00006198 [Rutstroemia sp. NJR-2017a BVV2]|nr:hypothetical protein CJF31_00006198 [Rutstroemia sp. NJR-2017a BVV2]